MSKKDGSVKEKKAPVRESLGIELDVEGEGIMEIPDSLVTYDEETGKICIGGKCINVQYEPETDDVVLEINPNAKCSPYMKKVVMAISNAMEKDDTRMKYRKRRSGKKRVRE